jgi:protein TonB
MIGSVQPEPSEKYLELDIAAPATELSGYTVAQHKQQTVHSKLSNMNQIVNNGSPAANNSPENSSGAASDATINQIVASNAGPATDTGADGKSAIAIPPKLLSSVAPVYPAIARKSGHSGKTLVIIGLAASGEILQATIRRTSGYAELDEAALTCVRQWQFSPARNAAGQPTPCRTTVPVIYKLN